MRGDEPVDREIVLLQIGVTAAREAHASAVMRTRCEHVTTVGLLAAVAVGVVEFRAAQPAVLPVLAGADQFISHPPALPTICAGQFKLRLVSVEERRKLHRAPLRRRNLCPPHARG